MENTWNHLKPTFVLTKAPVTTHFLTRNIPLGAPGKIWKSSFSIFAPLGPNECKKSSTTDVNDMHTCINSTMADVSQEFQEFAIDLIHFPCNNVADALRMYTYLFQKAEEHSQFIHGPFPKYYLFLRSVLFASVKKVN